MEGLKEVVAVEAAHNSEGKIKNGISGHGADRREKLSQACRDFESVFVSYMMQQMRRTVPQDGLLGGGKGEEMFTSMLDGEMAKSISSHQGLGLASMMFKQMVERLPDEK